MTAAGHRMAALWLLLLPFAIWGAHFLAVYVVTAIHCAKTSDPAAAILAVRWIATGITLLAFAALIATLWYGRRRCRLNNGDSPHSGTVPIIHQARFVWALLLMMSALSALAMLYVAAVVFFFGDCR